MNETPTLRQLFVCEKLIFEQGSGNVSLINSHTTRVVDQVPSLPAQFVVYGEMIDGFGPFTMQMRIMRLGLETIESIHQQSMRMVLADRLRDTKLVWRVNDLVFPAAGRYQVDLIANNEIIGMTTITVRVR